MNLNLSEMQKYIIIFSKLQILIEKEKVMKISGLK